MYHVRRFGPSTRIGKFTCNDTSFGEITVSMNSVSVELDDEKDRELAD